MAKGDSSKTGGTDPSFWDNYEGVKVLSNFALEGISAVSSFYVSKYETEAVNAEASIKYWTEYAALNEKNYDNYTAQLNSWYRASQYTEAKRQYEQDLAKQQAIYKGDVGTSATRNLEKQLGDLEGRYYEEEARDTVALEELRLKAFADASKKAAGGQVGRTVQAMNEQYNQRWLINASNRQITREYRLADKIRKAEALDVARENTTRGVQYYTPQPQADPVKPLAPKPVKTVAPLDKPGPSGGALALNLLGSGFNAALDYKASLPKPKASSGGSTQEEKPETT